MEYHYKNIYQREITPEQAKNGVISNITTYGIFPTFAAAKAAALERGFTDPLIADCASMLILNSKSGKVRFVLRNDRKEGSM